MSDGSKCFVRFIKSSISTRSGRSITPEGIEAEQVKLTISPLLLLPMYCTFKNYLDA